MSTFCYVTTESLPIGLLPVISADLRVSLSAVGLLVTGYGAVVAVMAVPLTVLTRQVPRRFLLGGVLTAFTLATALAAAIPNYWVLLVSRVATALTHAVFWSVVAAAATSLFPSQARGRVISLVYSGGSLAIVLGVPAGTWLGQREGWRSAFWVLTGMGLLALIGVATLLPTSEPQLGDSAAGSRPSRRRYWSVLAITTVAVTGAFTGYTYIAPFLVHVSGFSAETVGPLLLVDGAGGIAGVVAASVCLDRHPRLALLVSVVLLGVALIGLSAVGGLRVVVPLLLAMFGFGMAVFGAALQHRVMEVAPGNVDVASAGNSSAFNVGIATGAFIVGRMLPVFGVRAGPLVGGLITLTVLAVVLSDPPAS